MIKKVGVVSI